MNNKELMIIEGIRFYLYCSTFFFFVCFFSSASSRHPSRFIWSQPNLFFYLDFKSTACKERFFFPQIFLFFFWFKFLLFFRSNRPHVQFPLDVVPVMWPPWHYSSGIRRLDKNILPLKKTSVFKGRMTEKLSFSPQTMDGLCENKLKIIKLHTMVIVKRSWES